MTPFDAIAGLVRARSGLVLGPDKLYLMETRLAGLLAREGLRDLAMLAERLRILATQRRGAELARDVVELMTTNESLFFRDGKPFAHVRQQALARLHHARAPGEKLRIWSAAAATGQEAYSLAIVVAESRSILGMRPVEILGTDLARDPITRARAGLYSPFEVQRGLTAPLLAKYFTREDTGWRVADSLRAMVQFREWNLLSDLAPLGTFDVVFCRNVLIYFDPPTKARVLDAIAKQMAPDGLLYLGGAETTLGITSRFLPLATERGVYAPALGQAARPPPREDAAIELQEAAG